MHPVATILLQIDVKAVALGVYRFGTMASTGSTPVLGTRYQGTPSDISIRGGPAPLATEGFRYFQPFLEESEEEDHTHSSIHSSLHRSYGYR